MPCGRSASSSSVRAVFSLVIVCALLSVGTAVAAGDPGPMPESPGVAQRPAERAEGPTSVPAAMYNAAMKVLVTVCIVGMLVVAALLLFEERFIFRPTRAPAAGVVPEELGVEQCHFLTRDGVRLHAWWHPGEGEDDPARRPVVLWCHGNAGNLTHRADNLRILARSGLSVLLFDYRGYGQSQDKPSEVGLYLDAEAAYRYVVDQRGISPVRVVVFGRSLGSAVALHAALKHRTAGLIMESPFESVAAMVAQMPVLRVFAAFLKSRFKNRERVRWLKVPLLVVHGDRDRTVPIEQGRAVFAAAPEPKEFYVVEGAGHNDTYQVGGAEYRRRIAEFCRRCVGRAMSAES